MQFEWVWRLPAWRHLEYEGAGRLRRRPRHRRRPGAWMSATPTNDAPNPYNTIEGWAKLPAGREWGSTSAVEIDKDGKSIWVASVAARVPAEGGACRRTPAGTRQAARCRRSTRC